MKATSKPLAVFLAIALAFSPAIAAQAAVITGTGTPTTVTSDTDINLSGTLVHAGNWGSGSQSVVLSSETISFADRPTNNASDPYASATASGEYSAGDVFNGDTGNAPFNNVLDSFAYDGPNPKVVTISGLTPSNPYQIQLFTSDDRGCCGGSGDRFTPALTSGQTYLLGIVMNDTGGGGQFSDMEFKAPSGSWTDLNPGGNPGLFKAMQTPDNSVIKTGAGTTTFAGANTYNGTTSIEGGTLIAANSSALGTTDEWCRAYSSPLLR